MENIVTERKEGAFVKESVKIDKEFFRAHDSVKQCRSLDIVVGNIDGRTPRVRPRNLWLDNFKG